MATSKEKRAFVLMGCVTLIWAGLFPTGKIALQSIPPFTFSATRLVYRLALIIRLYGLQAYKCCHTYRLDSSVDRELSGWKEIRRGVLVWLVSLSRQ